jgi:hypothetical protein
VRFLLLLFIVRIDCIPESKSVLIDKVVILNLSVDVLEETLDEAVL